MGVKCRKGCCCAQDGYGGSGDSVSVRGIVGLAPGTQVNIEKGAKVAIEDGSKIEIAMNPKYYEADLFNETVEPLTNYDITANGTYYTGEIDTSKYQAFSWFIENDAGSQGTSVTTSIEYSPRPGNVSYWTANYVTDPYLKNGITSSGIRPDELEKGKSIIYAGKAAVRYAKIKVTVTGLNAGEKVTLRGIFEGEYYN